MDCDENLSIRIIRPYREADQAEVVGVWYRSKNNIWVGTINDRIVATMTMSGAYIDRL